MTTKGTRNNWILTTSGRAKMCNGCGRICYREEYSRDKSTFSGYKSRCRRCVSAAARRWNETHPERYAAAKKKYAKGHRARINAYQRKYYRRAQQLKEKVA